VAWRAPIDEDVKSAAGLSVTGATVTVRAHGGAQVAVYSAENGGSALLQPLTTVNGKIVEAGTQAQPYVAEGDYDYDVTFGGTTLTAFVPVRRGHQFVITLPAGAGTSAPEDGEEAIELYDAANGGAWYRRYRAASAAADKWDMIGGPPPAGATLPGSARARQEFYLTGGSPPVQHMRYNGTSWDFVGPPPVVPVPGSPLSIQEPGVTTQNRAGRNLVVADFTTLLALPTTPVGLFPLNGITNLGTGGALTNKGSVTFAPGILGTTHAAQFTGSTSQAFYIADTGAADPFRVKTGTVGCWVKTAKRGTAQYAITRSTGVSGGFGWFLQVNAGNSASLSVFDAAGAAKGGVASGATEVADDRWHFIVGSWDGTRIRIYIDGILESSVVQTGPSFIGAAPFNVGAWAVDAATNAPNTPFFGRVDEAFVTPDVLTEDQVRLLYAAAIPHGYASLPGRAFGSVVRRQRGGAMATTDFPTQPLRLHNFTAGVLTDQGSNNVALAPVGGGTITSTTGPDGAKDSAQAFSGAHTGLGATDAGLPSGTSSRSYGAWFKAPTAGASGQGVLGWGTVSTADARIWITGTSGVLNAASGADNIAAAIRVDDGFWHFACAVEDNAPIDGVKRRLYLDGRLIGTSTVLTSLTLAGANRFRIGSNPDGSGPLSGQVDGAFVYAGALTAEQVRGLYNLGSRALSASPFSAEELVEAIDATNLYVVLDRLDAQNQINLQVAG
jgi:hypothetical protein